TVKLIDATYQEKPVVVSEEGGRTDATGRYSFQFVLPDHLTGMPRKNEQAFLDLTAEVRDTALHREETTLSLLVAQNELDIKVIPEAGALVPGVENLLYILTAYPDGRPAACKVFVNGTAYQSDLQGACEIQVEPANAGQPLDIQAIDAAGRKVRFTHLPEDKSALPALLLRTDKAVYQAGAAATLTILSPEKGTTVFIDVIKDGQTVLTRSVPLADHKAEYALALPPSLVGVLRINAYMISATGEDRGCSRMLYINPASG